jgi:hypothetical protein
VKSVIFGLESACGKEFRWMRRTRLCRRLLAVAAAGGNRKETNIAQDKFALARDFLVNAIHRALSALGKGGLVEKQLLLGTAIEGSFLIHRQQPGGGPALGVF